MTETVRINLALDKPLTDKLDSACVKNKTTVTHLIRIFIRLGLKVLELQERGIFIRYTAENGKEVQLELMI